MATSSNFANFWNFGHVVFQIDHSSIENQLKFRVPSELDINESTENNLIPKELICNILSFLYPNDLLRISQVCKSLYICCKDYDVLQASISMVFLKIQLLKNGPLSAFQQYVLIWDLANQHINKINAFKNYKLQEVATLKNSVDAYWKTYVCISNECKEIPLNKDDLQKGLIPKTTDTALLSALNEWVEHDVRLSMQAGNAYDGNNASTIDSNSILGQLQAQIAGIFDRYNDNYKLESLIQSIYKI